MKEKLTKELRELLKPKNVRKLCYTIGQSFAYIIFVGFGILLLSNSGVQINLAFIIAYILGAMGTHWYAEIKYDYYLQKNDYLKKKFLDSTKPSRIR